MINVTGSNKGNTMEDNLDTMEGRVNKMYKEDGWGILGIEDGFNPFNTESSARQAFRFCWESLDEFQKVALRDKHG